MATAFLDYREKENACLTKLWFTESRWDNYARPRDSKGRATSTAFGIAQLLGEKSRNPAVQIARGLKYLNKRFGGSACRAWEFHLRHGWY